MAISARGVWNRLTGRSIRTSLHRLTTTSDDLRKRVGRQRKMLERQTARVDRLEASDRRRAEAERERGAHLRMLRLDLDRMSAQLGALEVRLAEVADQLDLSVPPKTTMESDDPAAAEARSRLGEIRREHEQIRVRFRVITAYEERIRRLEEAVHGEDSVLPEGPQLDPVLPTDDAGR